MFDFYKELAINEKIAVKGVFRRFGGLLGFGVVFYLKTIKINFWGVSVRF